MVMIRTTLLTIIFIKILLYILCEKVKIRNKLINRINSLCKNIKVLIILVFVLYISLFSLNFIISKNQNYLCYDPYQYYTVQSYKLVPTHGDYYLCVLNESGKIQYTIESGAKKTTCYKSNLENCYIITNGMNTLTKVKARFKNIWLRTYLGDPLSTSTRYYFYINKKGFKSMIN